MVEVNNCRIGGDPLVELFSLGNIFVSNFLEEEDCECDFAEGDLTLAIGKKSGLVQLTNNIDFDLMYRKYWYNSGTNKSMTEELKNLATTMSRRIKWSSGDKWLDIGCNDGTLLSFVPDKMVKIGIDPSNSANSAIKHAEKIIPDYFNYDAVSDEGKFKFISAIAMFYDLNEPHNFLRDIHKCLDDEGLFVVQMSYLPLMLEQLAFDNICHEHLTYYSLEVLNSLFNDCGLKIVDCEVNDVNGGSFRVYAQKQEAPVSSFMTAPFRDVANFRVKSTLEYEKTMNLKDPETYKNWFQRVESLKWDTIEMISELKNSGKTIWAYGASTKGNTLLQYFGIDCSLIDAIAERQSIKYGLRTVGTDIPIKSEHEMREARPDYVLVLPWHFINEFKDREKEFLEYGKFIVPCPKLEIIGA